MDESIIRFLFGIALIAFITFVATWMIYDKGTTVAQVSEMHKACLTQGGLKEVRRDTATCLNGTKIVVPWKG